MNTIEQNFESQLDSLKVVTLTDGEVWSARDLMPFAGYTNWRKWSGAIDRAIESVNASGLNAADHFVGGVKMVEVGSGARRQVDDVEVTRYGAYILFQNGDPRKPEIAAAQQYFAVKTRQAETAAPALPSGPELMALGLLEAQKMLSERDQQIAELAPKAEYVDTFVTDTDLRLVRNVAKSIGVTEQALRADLLERGWIYAEHATRWSESKRQKVAFTRYSPYSHKAQYFCPVPNHEAPRFKGEVMHTLKITPEGATAIARLYGRHLKAVDSPAQEEAAA